MPAGGSRHCTCLKLPQADHLKLRIESSSCGFVMDSMMNSIKAQCDGRYTETVLTVDVYTCVGKETMQRLERRNWQVCGTGRFGSIPWSNIPMTPCPLSSPGYVRCFCWFGGVLFLVDLKCINLCIPVKLLVNVMRVVWNTAICFDWRSSSIIWFILEFFLTK